MTIVGELHDPPQWVRGGSSNEVGISFARYSRASDNCRTDALAESRGKFSGRRGGVLDCVMEIASRHRLGAMLTQTLSNRMKVGGEVVAPLLVDLTRVDNPSKVCRTSHNVHDPILLAATDHLSVIAHTIANMADHGNGPNSGFDAPVASSHLRQTVLNTTWPMKDTNGFHARGVKDQEAENQIDVTVRVILSEDGETYLDGRAIAWSHGCVMVAVNDVRLRPGLVWVRGTEVKRR